MRADHLKGWLEAARKKEREEAAAKQENRTKGRTMSGTDGTGGGGEIREKTPTEASN